jgi:hypothetical protein
VSELQIVKCGEDYKKNFGEDTNVCITESSTDLSCDGKHRDQAEDHSIYPITLPTLHTL